MKSVFFSAYLTVGILVCLWFLIAAIYDWRAPNFGFLDGPSSGSSYGRSYGGAWGGGK